MLSAKLVNNKYRENMIRVVIGIFKGSQFGRQLVFCPEHIAEQSQIQCGAVFFFAEKAAKLVEFFFSEQEICQNR